jgi:glutamyl-tRNA synthetase
MAERARPWYSGIEGYDESAVSKHLLGAADVLRAARAGLAEAPEWSPAAVDSALRNTAETLGLGVGKVAQPLRVAITGTQVSPSIDHTVYLCGREEALRRIDAALELIAARS